MKDINDPEFLKKLTSVRPSARQIAWQEMEFYGFIHYGVNQFTDREWGDGREDPQIFNPQKLDTDQWCESLAKATMTGVIITAKHHDGFCLWDTKTTTHSVMHSPYGKDIVAQVAESCRKYGLKLGIYLSPWDQNNACYGSGDAYNDLFCEQLTELMTNYGDLFCLWFDGACGEGPNGKVQQYDWERYYTLIRKYQPDAVISICGPDVRWCGNEGGHTRKSEWSVVPATLADNEKIQHQSQQADDAEFRNRIPTSDQDLGSREVLINHQDLIWYPAEVNTSIRPGWFYHEEEDDKLRALENLKEIYLNSVGGNATFLLNVPPHGDGYIAPGDVKRLEELGDWIKESFSNDLVADEENLFLIGRPHYKPSKYSREYEFEENISPKYLLLQEDITMGQRIESFNLLWYNFKKDEWILACCGTVVGYKSITPIKARSVSYYWKLEIFYREEEQDKNSEDYYYFEPKRFALY